MSNVTAERVRQAVAKAQAGLFHKQSPDGAWRGADSAGPPTTGWALAALAYLGVLDRFDAPGAVRYLLSRQLPSGAFPDYPSDDTGSLAATAACYAGLYGAGQSPQTPPMERAWQYIKTHGGFEATDPITQVFLAGVGLISPTALPTIPMGWMLIPGARRLIGQHVNSAFQLILSALPGLIRGLQRDRRNVPTPSSDLLAWMEEQNLIRYLRKVQDPSGNWLGVILHTTLCAMTLYALGLPKSDPAIVRALAYVPTWKVPVQIEGHSLPAWSFVPYQSEVWNTALSVAALVRSGIAPTDPRIKTAVVYLLSTQGRLPEPPEWQNPPCGAPRSGGWAFEESNSYNLDCDSTSQVLRALSMVRQLPSVEQAIAKGQAWLLGMQNDDGGWPAFTHGQASKPAGPYPLGTYMPTDLLQQILVIAGQAGLFFGDPATEDVTGRVVEALGLLGLRLSSPAVQQAVDFLRAQVFENGVWWGRWENNFIPSSAYILKGLASVGEDVQAPYIRRAVAWIESHQNADGGFGERIDSYGNLAFAGIGDSNPYSTGLVVSALLAIGGRRHVETIHRAVDYLLAQQCSDGLWSGDGCLLVMNAPLPFYRLPADVWDAPLQALADYLILGGGVSGVQPQ